MKWILLLPLIWMTTLVASVKAETWTDWHYHAEITVSPQEDDSFDAVYADFSHFLKHTFEESGAFDENSIRIVALQDGEIGEPVPSRFVPVNDYDSATNAAGTIVFLVTGSKEETLPYRIYFDTVANGPKPALAVTSDLPEEANMVWNGGFEIQSGEANSPNRYKNHGEGMPHGWWGNITRIPKNYAIEAHRGEHAMGLKVAEDQTSSGIRIAPSVPGIRVIPGQDYLFSYWIKGVDLSSEHPSLSSLTWLDEEGKPVGTRIRIVTGLANKSNYDWTAVEAYFPAPPGAAYVAVSITTRSKTGVLMLDDIVIRPAVPRLLTVE